MRSIFPNDLSIAEFAFILGINPWNMAGFGTNVPQNTTADLQSDGGGTGCCDATCWLDNGGISGQLSRADVSAAIMVAETKFFDHIGYYPAPRYAVEKVDYPQTRVIGVPNSMFTAHWEPKSVDLLGGYFRALGVELCAMLEEGAALVPTFNLDLKVGIPEVSLADGFEVTVTVPDGTTPEEIHLYFTEADRLEEPREQWEIRPIRVKQLTPTSMKISGAAYLLVKPVQQIRPDADCLDTLDDDNYVTTAEVWRCVTDTTQQGVLGWNIPGDCSNPPCRNTEQPFCALDVGDGICSAIAPSPAVWDEDTLAFKYVPLTICQVPAYVRVNYLSGFARRYGLMDRVHAQIIAYLAAAELDCTLCSCTCTGKKLALYRDYPKTVTDESDNGRGYTRTEKREYKKEYYPFGERTGEVKAWQLAEPKMVCR